MRLASVVAILCAAVVAYGCLADRRAAAQSVVAEGQVRRVAACLLEYARDAGEYPPTLAELRVAATKPASACAGVGAAVLSGSEYAGYAFRYSGGGKRFALTAGPTSAVPYHCDFSLTEEYRLRRSCSGRFSAPEVVERDLRAGPSR
jgi:hypothetical protein